MRTITPEDDTVCTDPLQLIGKNLLRDKNISDPLFLPIDSERNTDRNDVFGRQVCHGHSDRLLTPLEPTRSHAGDYKQHTSSVMLVEIPIRTGTDVKRRPLIITRKHGEHGISFDIVYRNQQHIALQG
ncbi:hypothetical protein WT61_20085 [Burkholderia stagnalis]|nr:hypothetical protein WT61_20085 [Burkholderia stagnalis]KWH57168.1 hypothetical protein WT62_30530 [Burkholderia stagnalis]